MLDYLASLGFTQASILSQTATKATVRVRTSKGWTYERFPQDDTGAIDRWALHHEPEPV
jgi:hypothetical protein